MRTTTEHSQPQAWPGVFRPLRHHVAEDARGLMVAGRWVYFALCGSACWPPAEGALDLPWCPACSARHRRHRR